MKIIALLTGLLACSPWVTSAASASSTAAQVAPAKPSQHAIAAGLKHFLADRGTLCVGKYDWPIQVAAGALEAGDRNAVQLPVLAQLGLVAAAPGPDDSVRYTLTEAGQQFYWPRKNATGETVRDFCAGRLQLESVVGWTAPVLREQHYETTVTYTYTMDAAAWTAEPGAQRVFPMIARVVKGQHSAKMMQRLRLDHGRWEGIAAAQ